MPPHDRIVHENLPAGPSSTLRDRIQFHLHAEMTDRCLRLNEGAADIVVTDQSHAQRHAGFLRESHGGADAGIGHRHDDVGRHRLFAREDAPQIGPDLVDAASEDVTVRPREVDMFENAMRQRRRRETA